MGWIWIRAINRKPNGKVDVLAECRHLYDGADILKSRLVGTTFYAAVRNGDGRVWCLVVLTSTARDGYYDFGYKDMDDSWGPWKRDCPDSILDLLTPTDDAGANEWREACRKHNRDARTLKALDDGSRAVWTVPSSGFTGLEEGERVPLRLGRRSWRKRSKRIWEIEGTRYFVSMADVKLDDLELVS